MRNKYGTQVNRRTMVRVWAVTVANGPERGFSTYYRDRETAIKVCHGANAFHAPLGTRYIVTRRLAFRNWERVGY